MWLLMFLGAFASVSVSAQVVSNAQVFRKCCPNNEGLVHVLGEDGPEVYECLDRDSLNKKYNVSEAPLIIGDSVPVEYGIPSECDYNMTLLNADELYLQVLDNDTKCYDRLMCVVKNGTVQENIPKIVQLRCLNNETETTISSKLSFDYIRTCCPIGQRYDTMYHSCRHNDTDPSDEGLLEMLKINDNEHIYEVSTGLTCKYEEYAAELSGEKFEFSLEGSKLRLLKRADGSSTVSPSGEWCVARKAGGSGLVARVCTRDCSSLGVYCLRKCCPVGEHYKTRWCGRPVGMCVPNDEDLPFDVSSYLDPLRLQYPDLEDSLGIRSDLRCTSGRIRLNNSLAVDDHELTRDGLMHGTYAHTIDYCLETFDSRHCPKGGVEISAITCYIKLPEIKDFRITFVVICVSSVCLALTLIVYCSLPELRNLHGRTLICHVSTMLLAFCCLGRAQHMHVPDTQICTLLGYGIYFGFVAAFAWLNVMCFDIWWTFGSVRTVQPLRKASAEWRRFFWYSLYAWGSSILMTVTMFLFDKYPVSKILDANMGNSMCWFGSVANTETDWPHYIFFVTPMGLVTGTNFVLWILTARHCARVKAEVHRLQAGSAGDRAQRRFRVDRAKYTLTGKLWVVMGAGWITELLSTLTSEPLWLWTIIDLINGLQGVFIFLILVFKPKVYYLIRKKLGLEKPDAQKNGPSSSGRTSSTFFSRTISSDDRNNRLSHTNNIKKA